MLAWGFLVQLLAIRAFAGGVLPASPDISLSPCQIDVNRAGVGALQSLPSVGPARAEALVLERVRNGPFTQLSDLSRVHGFGPEILIRLAGFVCFDAGQESRAR